MNVHDHLRYGPKPRNYKSRNTAETPRTRPGMDYPGGKSLRKALGVLNTRKRVLAGQKSTQGETSPGSMKGRGL